MDKKRKKEIEDRIGKQADKLKKFLHESEAYKVEAAEKILKSLIGQNLGYNGCVEGSNVVLNIFDAEDNFEHISEIIVKDNKISVICTAWSYKDCFCGIDEIDRAVRGLNDIIEYSRTNNI